MLADLGCRIGRRADALRLEQGLTKAKLADNADIDPSSISVFLNGGRPEISVQTLVRVAWGLGVDVNVLLDLDVLTKGQADGEARREANAAPPHSLEDRLVKLEAMVLRLSALPEQVANLADVAKDVEDPQQSRGTKKKSVRGAKRA